MYREIVGEAIEAARSQMDLLISLVEMADSKRARELVRQVLEKNVEIQAILSRLENFRR